MWRMGFSSLIWCATWSEKIYLVVFQHFPVQCHLTSINSLFIFCAHGDSNSQLAMQVSNLLWWCPGYITGLPVLYYSFTCRRYLWLKWIYIVFTIYSSSVRQASTRVLHPFTRSNPLLYAFYMGPFLEISAFMCAQRTGASLPDMKQFISLPLFHTYKISGEIDAKKKSTIRSLPHS